MVDLAPGNRVRNRAKGRGKPCMRFGEKRNRLAEKRIGSVKKEVRHLSVGGSPVWKNAKRHLVYDRLTYTAERRGKGLWVYHSIWKVGRGKKGNKKHVRVEENFLALTERGAIAGEKKDVPWRTGTALQRSQKGLNVVSTTRIENLIKQSKLRVIEQTGGKGRDRCRKHKLGGGEDCKERGI